MLFEYVANEKAWKTPDFFISWLKEPDIFFSRQKQISSVVAR